MRVCAAVLVVSAFAVNARAADWPAFHHGGALVGVAEPIGPPPMKVRWTYRSEETDAGPTTRPVDSRPSFEASAAIANGRAYVADRAGHLIALDLKTGTRQWIYTSEAGFSASPAVANGVVYIGDEDGVFHAVNADSGHKLWTFDAGSGIHSSANFDGNRIIFGTDGASIFCLNGADATKIWEARAGDRINSAPAIGAAMAGQPALAYVSGCDQELRALDLSNGKERFAKDLGALCPGSPALLEGKIVVATDGGRVLCLSPDGKQQFWTFEGVENQAMVYASPAVADGIVVVGARDRNVYGLDLASGKPKWKFPTRGDVDSSAVISAGRVYIGSKDKRLYVLDLHTGRKLWDFVASRAILATPAIAEGVLVIGDTGGNLYCLETSAR